MTITIPDKLSHALSVYAEKRNTTPERLAMLFISRSVPAPSKMLVCCACGAEFPGYKSNTLYCSAECYKSVPFPRLGITLAELSDCYGSSISVAAEALGVSIPQMRRTIKKFGLQDRFLTRG